MKPFAFPALLSLLGLCFAGPLVAQDKAAPPQNAPVTAAKPAGMPGTREVKDLPYVTGGSDRQKLDLCLPETSTSPRPLVAWIHGGGWEAGNKNSCPAKVLVGRGYAVASIGYRLSQQAVYPAQIEDCKAAVRWLRAHASEYGIDPKRIGVWGESAGGHLVALLGTTGNIRDFDVGENLDQSSKVQCVLDWYGPTDFLHYGEPPKKELDRPGSAVAKLLGGTVTEHPADAKRASPVYFVTSESAPFLIMQGDKDPLVPLQQSELLNTALKKAGVETELEVIPGGGHGGPGFITPDERKRMADFLDRHLQQHAVSVEPSRK